MKPLRKVQSSAVVYAMYRPPRTFMAELEDNDFRRRFRNRRKAVRWAEKRAVFVTNYFRTR